MPNTPSTTTNNHEEYQLVVDLEDVILKSKYPIGSNDDEEVGLVPYYHCPHYQLGEDKFNKPLMDYSNSHVVTSY
jgi:hypothetical protein